MRIRELAGITSPEPRQLLVQPWNNGTLGPTARRVWRRCPKFHGSTGKRQRSAALQDLSGFRVGRGCWRGGSGMGLEA